MSNLINHVLVISPFEYVHSQAMFDIAVPMSESLKALGHPAEVTIDPSVCGGRTLVFGAHLLPKFKGSISGGDYIIFNLEQVNDSGWWDAAQVEAGVGSDAASGGNSQSYIDILKRYPVWDYSVTNIAALKEKGIEAKHCPIGYHPCMSNIMYGKSTILLGGGAAPVRVGYAPWPTVGLPVGVFDVLFYGSMNERRQRVIDDLRKAGLNTVVVNGYGAYRDKYIQRAKVVLNLNFYSSAIFNIARVSHLLANGKAVVSEESIEGDDYRGSNSWRSPDAGVAFAPYDGLVEKCREVVAGDYTALGKTGFDIFSKREMVEILRPLVCL